MPKRRGDSPILTALLLGGWATIYIGAIILAVEDSFPALARMFPPLPATLVLGALPVRWIYLIQRDLRS